MIRFHNGLVMSFQGGLKVGPAELWTDGDKISYIGATPDRLPKFEREIDLHGDLVMPGMKNAHTHTAMTFLRSYADDMPLDRWLSEQVWPNEAKLSGEAVYVLATLGMMEYLSGGVTACFDMYVKNDFFVQASLDCGFRSVICSGLNNFDADIANIEREYLKYNSFNELISYKLGIHAEYTTSMERMEYLVSLCEKYKAPAFTHLAETKSEVDGCIERYGLTPTQLLDKIGFFKYGGGGFHCVYMSEDDIALFAGKGLYAVTNPGSNLKLASGIAPVQKMRDAGIKIAIGTDGAASNNALDMFREMYLVTALQKVVTGDAAVCPAEAVLEMACVNGADCLGLTDCNDLAVGKKADLTVISLGEPNMQPINNIAKNLVYSGSKKNVRLTVINGRVLYEDGQYFTKESPERIYALANEFVRSLK